MSLGRAPSPSANLGGLLRIALRCSIGGAGDRNRLSGCRSGYEGVCRVSRKRERKCRGGIDWRQMNLETTIRRPCRPTDGGKLGIRVDREVARRSFLAM